MRYILEAAQVIYLNTLKELKIVFETIQVTIKPWHLSVFISIFSLAIFYLAFYLINRFFAQKKARRYDYLSKENRKQQQKKIENFKANFPQPIKSKYDSILSASVCELVKNVSNGIWSAESVVLTYCWKASEVHEKTNCLTEILFEEALELAKNMDNLPDTEKTGSLFGVPVSLKDCIDVAGFPSSVGIINWRMQFANENATIVDQLISEGAIPFCKTNVPQSMRSFECRNPLWGSTKHPIKSTYSPGGSSGGEAALISAGGSILGIGNDIAGSVRIPAHFCGLYTIKPSVYRISNKGVRSISPITPLINPTIGPMTRTFDDMIPFISSCVARSGLYDVLPMSNWNKLVDESISNTRKLRFGVMKSNSYLDATPACKRAVDVAVKSLIASGHEVIEFKLPFDADELVRIFYSIIVADGGKFLKKALSDEPLEASIAPFLNLIAFPTFVISLFSFVARFYQDKRPKLFLESFGPKSTYEIGELVQKQKHLAAKIHKAWETANIDAIITPPFASPALPEGAFIYTSNAASYSFIWNVLDFVAGIVPVTTVDSELDKIFVDMKSKKDSSDVLKSSRVLEAEIESFYDANEMHGLPIGVQIVTPQFCELECLQAMKALSDAIKKTTI